MLDVWTAWRLTVFELNGRCSKRNGDTCHSLMQNKHALVGSNHRFSVVSIQVEQCPRAHDWPRALAGPPAAPESFTGVYTMCSKVQTSKKTKRRILFRTRASQFICSFLVNFSHFRNFSNFEIMNNQPVAHCEIATTT